MEHATPPAGDNLAYMHLALVEAKKSPPKPSNFCVGAVLVSGSSATDTSEKILETGYTLEMPGNTHAEQSCLLKLAAQHGVTEEELPFLSESALPARLALYTTMEPCSFRLSGNLPCVERVLRLAGLKHVGDGGKATRRSVTVYVGVTEPDKFVAENTGRKTLEEAGIKVIHVPGLEEEILAVATAGHKKENDGNEEKK